MQAPAYPWSLRSTIWNRPNLGALLTMLEENYRLLSRLIPQMHIAEGSTRSTLDSGLDLHLEVLEQTPYTSLLHLTYYFPHENGAVLPDPDTRVRAYHDAGQVEVLDLRQTVLPLSPGPHYPSLEQKWKANLFLGKWLSYCLFQGHRFSVENWSAPCWNEMADSRRVKTL